MTKKTEKLEISNGSEAAMFEAKHCHRCAHYIYWKKFDGEGCRKQIDLYAWAFGSAPEWYQIWIDGEPGPTGCKAFEDIAVRSDRAKQAHVTMKENEYNDPRQLKLF